MSAIAGTMSYLAGVDLAITLSDGRVLVFGWASAGEAEVWDPVTGTFSVAPGPPHRVVTATLLDDGRVLVTGDSGGAGSWAGTYDPATGQTRDIGGLPSSDAVATRLTDGRVLLVGGMGSPDPMGTRAPGSGRWRSSSEPVRVQGADTRRKLAMSAFACGESPTGQAKRVMSTTNAVLDVDRRRRTSRRRHSIRRARIGTW